MKISKLICVQLIGFLASCGYVQEKNMENKSWFVAAEMPAVQQKSLGYAGPIVGVSNDVLLVMGGANFPDKMPWLGGAKKYYALYSAFQYEKDGHLSLLRSGTLDQNMAYSATCQTEDGFIVAGGENEEGPLAQVKRFRWSTIHQDVEIHHLPNLPYAVTNGHLVRWENIIYFAGGENASQVFNQVFALDIQHPDQGWTLVTTLPQPISSGILLADSGKLWMIGGRMKHPKSPSTFYPETFVFDIKTHQWSAADPLPYGIAAGTGTVINHRLFVFGGDQGTTFNKTEKLIFDIAAENNPVVKQKLIDEKANLQNNHPGFSHEVWSLNTKDTNAAWKKIDSLPFPSQVTTVAVPFHDYVYIANGEIKAGVRTPNITAVAASYLLQK